MDSLPQNLWLAPLAAGIACLCVVQYELVVSFTLVPVIRASFSLLQRCLKGQVGEINVALIQIRVGSTVVLLPSSPVVARYSGAPRTGTKQSFLC